MRRLALRFAAECLVFACVVGPAACVWAFGPVNLTLPAGLLGACVAIYPAEALLLAAERCEK